MQLAYTGSIPAADVQGSGDASGALCSEADLNFDDSVDDRDVGVFVNGLDSQSLIGDMNADGVVDGADISQFVDAFIAGVPQ